jgi:thiosulfate dehydrogenase [quinone] large subunit
MKRYTVEQSSFAHLLFADTRLAALWLVVRLYLGYEWLMAGWEKFQNPAWFGPDAGSAISGFAQGALHKTAAFCTNAASCHPDVQDWYAFFLQHTLVTHPYLWSHLITLGELAVGLGLLVGCLTGLAAFFGVFMNLNFLLAGSVSLNPVMATFGILLVLAHRVAGYWGCDRYVTPFVRRTFGRARGG